MAVDSGDGGAQYWSMSIRGKDAQETRFRRYLWWQANRDWLGVVLSVSAVIGAFVAIAHAFG
jgi:hypothetical protein